MNGTNVPDYGGRSVYENAVRATESVIDRAVRHNDQREPNPEWDVRAEVYGKTVGRVEKYMIAGNGPTEWVCFVFDEEGDLDHAYLHYSSSPDSAVVLLGQFDGEDLYQQMKDYR